MYVIAYYIDYNASHLLFTLTKKVFIMPLQTLYLDKKKRV